MIGLGGGCVTGKSSTENIEFYFTFKNRKLKRILSKQSLLRNNNDPIIILGKSASGKTTLANGLLHDYIIAELKATKITCERLLNEVVTTIKSDINMDILAQRYDVLIIDEIEDLSWKNSTQEYIAEWIKMLNGRNTQIILLGIDKHSDCFVSLFTSLESYQVYNLHSLKRIERVMYILKRLRSSKIQLPFKDVCIISKEKNMCAIEGMIKTILVWGTKRSMNSKMKLTHNDVLTALNGRLWICCGVKNKLNSCSEGVIK